MTTTMSAADLIGMKLDEAAILLVAEISKATDERIRLSGIIEHWSGRGNAQVAQMITRCTELMKQETAMQRKLHVIQEARSL